MMKLKTIDKNRIKKICILIATIIIYVFLIVVFGWIFPIMILCHMSSVGFGIFLKKWFDWFTRKEIMFTLSKNRSLTINCVPIDIELKDPQYVLDCRRKNDSSEK